MTQSQIQKFFNKAREVSKLSDFDRVHIGCVIVYKKTVIGIGFNTWKTSPMQKRYNKPVYKQKGYIETKNAHSMHAEINALNSVRHLDVDWGKCSMFIYREHKRTHLPLLAKPCDACQRAIEERGIGNVYYTTEGVMWEEL